MREYDQITKALAAGTRPFEIEPKFAVCASELPRLLMHEAPAVLHFSGHCNDLGELIFQDDTGRPYPADSASIARIFSVLRNTVRCVVLNACFTSHQAKKIVEHVDAVIGLRQALEASQAIAFSRGLYEALAEGRSVGTAFEVGKLRLELRGSSANAEPVLFIREGLDDVNLGCTPTPEPDDPIPPVELQRYMDKVQAMYEHVRLLGFTTKTRLSLKLDELYVSLDAVLSNEHLGCAINTSAEVIESPPGLDHHRERIRLSKVFERARQRGRRGLVLLGDPGSGKTTVLTHMLLSIVRDGPESIGLPRGTVPVYLPLQSLQDRPAGLPGFIRAQLRDPLLDLAPDFGERLCRRHKLLLLLDGLDEVADSKERAEVSRWIEQILTASTDNYVLVSCRYAGYDRANEFEDSFLELNLRPLDNEQMRQFVKTWCLLVERERGCDPDLVASRAEREANELLEVLESTAFTAVSRVYELTRNPLLLTAICLVHHDYGRLPQARAKLYEESITVLLARWHESRPETRLSADVDDALELLKPIAAWMHAERGRKRATKTELLAPVSRALARLPGVDVDAKQFLRLVRDECGLLTGWGVDEYGFMHLGFQEFLTAQHLRNEVMRDPRVFMDIAARFGDSWWREVILLMLAQRNPSVFDPFMEALVKQPQFADWWNSETMQLCFREAANATAKPFIALIQEHDGRSRLARFLRLGTERASGLGKRQLAAVKLLEREMPEQLEQLSEQLENHRSPRVRAFWQRDAVSRRSTESSLKRAPRGGVRLVGIDGGPFAMGSPPDEAGRWGAEGPQHTVALASFYLARTPVTNAEYASYLQSNPRARKPDFWADRAYNKSQQPVVGISWGEAKAYCEWAGLNLPTEAQWEYACRAGTSTRYWAGDSTQDLARVGCYRANSDGKLQPVAQKLANAFGLHDMHGNVWEWCLDVWYANYESVVRRPSDGARRGAACDGHRVFRGGSWSDSARCARSAYRSYDHPGYRDAVLGFRPVMVAD